jgi:CheY-like chemotaxis protein
LSPPGGCDILLVEDDPNDVELTLRALRRRNLAHSVHVARDGAEALELLLGPGVSVRSQSPGGPKVIFLDLKLPKVSGLEVLKKLKSDARTRRIPVVVVTSSREIKDITQSYELGVNSYIVKPVDFERFAESISVVGVYWLTVNQSPRP